MIRPSTPKKASQPRFTMRQWARMAVAALILAAFGWLYLFELGTLLPLSPTEQASAAQAMHPGQLLHNPLNLVYKLPLFVLQHLGHHPALLRLPAVLFTGLSIALCFLLCRKWYGTVTAAATTVLFGSSTWLLQTGRFGAAYAAMLCAAMAMVAAAAWLKTSPSRKTAIAYGLACCLASLTPGGIWLVVAIGLLVSKQLFSVVRQDRAVALPALSLMAILVLGLLGYAFAGDTGLIAAWLGLPASFPAPLEIAKQALMSVSFLIARGPVKPEIWLAHTPLLDAASTIFGLVGIMLYGRNLQTPRSLLLIACCVPAVLLIALNGASALAFIVPVAYLVIGGGLAYFFREWRKVFPRNPVAHSLAAVVVVALLACVVRYHVVRYFIAWRNSPDTVQAYRSPAAATEDNLLQ